MSTNNQQDSQSSISFLDVIACAFGAIVLLILILPIGESASDEPESVDLTGVGRLLLLIDTVNEEINMLGQQVAMNEKLIADIESEAVTIENATQQATAAVQSTIEQLNSVKAQQETLESTAAILSEPVPQTPETQVVASELSGIPVDSEYLVFVVDTSGSMQTIWRSVIQEIERFWKLYPTVKGFQIMNDNGHYLSKIGRGRWLPDNKIARSLALRQMNSWKSFSNSSPAEGIVEAISDLYSDDRKMAIVVVGDEYSGRSYKNLLDEIDRKVRARSVKEENLRIHALGFWNHVPITGDRFARLMRALTRKYQGAFVAIEGKQWQNFSSPSIQLPIPLPSISL